MSRIRIVLLSCGALSVAAVAAAGGALFWASSAAEASLSRKISVHDAGFTLPSQPDPEAAARGAHLVQARYGCASCHGADLGGGVMVDDPMLGSFYGPNLTTGGPTGGYTAAEWDRIVRHGVKADGTVALMPSVDFFSMSDQELGDIVVYLRSLPPVDRQQPPSSLGPVGRVLVATGGMPASADLLPDHSAPHRSAPPATEDTVAFGAHLGATCSGCHGADFSGGPVVGGDPSWPPASNLTPGPGGLGGWSFEQFQRAMVDSVRPDGAAIRAPMREVGQMAARMTEVEQRALWAYLQSLPARASES